MRRLHPGLFASLVVQRLLVTEPGMETAKTITAMLEESVTSLNTMIGDLNSRNFEAAQRDRANSCRVWVVLMAQSCWFGRDEREIDDFLSDPADDDRANLVPPVPEHPAARLGDVFVDGRSSARLRRLHAGCCRREVAGHREAAPDGDGPVRMELSWTRSGGTGRG
jgi:hypothetical protein